MLIEVLVLLNTALNDNIQTQLQEIGFVIRSVTGHIISGLIPENKLVKLQQMNFIERVEKSKNIYTE